MANWKTYTNTKYGFSFKFPAHWQYRYDEQTGGMYEEINFQIALTFFPGGSAHDGTINGNEFMIIYFTDGDIRTLDYLKSEYYSKSTMNEIGEKPALKDEMLAIIKVDSSKSIEIRGDPLNKPVNRLEAAKYFNQILSTFKFID